MIRVPMWKVMALIGGKPDTDKVIEFERDDFVVATGVAPEGKTEDELVTAIVEAFLADAGSRTN